MSRSPGRARTVVDAARLFAALGDRTRLALVSRLGASGPLSLARLTEGATISRQAVTKHLRALEDAGLVRSERSGRERICELEPRRLARVRRHLEQISRGWDAALDRLRILVEEEDP